MAAEGGCRDEEAAARLSLAAFALDPDGEPALRQLRHTFLQEYASKPAEGTAVGPRHDARDLHRVRTEAALLRRVLCSRGGSLEEAARALDDSLRWRREFEINDLTELSFETVLLEQGAIYIHGLDRDSNRLLWLHVRLSMKSQLEKRRLVAFWVERHTQRDPDKKITVVFDMAETGLSHVDLDFIRFVINCFKIYYPGLLSKIIVFEMPWIMNAAWKIIKGWLGPEAIQVLKFVSRGDVQEHIGAESLPPHMGGLDKFRYSYPPLPEDDLFKCPDPSPEDEEEAGDGKDADEVWTNATLAPPSQPPPPLSSSSPSSSSPSSPPLKVTFADDADGRCLTGEPCEPPPGETRGKKLKRPVSTFHGPLLNISPTEELQFGSREVGGDTRCLMVLSNATQVPVAFKVKTTAPEKYRVRPSSGSLNAGATCDVHIALLTGHAASQQDKFQVIAAEMRADCMGVAPLDLPVFWKNVPRASVIEHRLRCRVVNDARNGGVSRARQRDGAGGGDGGGLRDQRDELMSQVASLSASVHQLHANVRELGQQAQRVLWLQKLLLLLLLLALLFLHWLDRSPADHSKPAPWRDL